MSLVVRLCVAASLALVCSVSIAQQSFVRNWERSLKQIFFTEGAPMVVDIDWWAEPPTILYDQKYGARGMERVADRIERSWSQVNGVQVFARSAAGDPFRSVAKQQIAVDFLRSLSIVELGDLRKGTLSYADLEDSEKRLIRHLIAREGGAIAEPILTDAYNRIAMRLVMRPHAVAPDGSLVDISIGELDLTFPGAIPVESVQLDPSAEGEDFDFGDGRVVTLFELSNLIAESGFGAWKYDLRLANSTYFVAGKFSHESLKLAFEKVMVVDPLSGPVAPPVGLEATIASMMDRAFGSVNGQTFGFGNATYGDFVTGQTKKVQELFGAEPESTIRRMMDRVGLTMDGSVTLAPQFALIIGTPGFSQIDTGDRDANGTPIILPRRNRVIVSLSFSPAS